MIPESTLNADPENHAVPSDLEIPPMHPTEGFGEYWRRLRGEQAVALAVVSWQNKTAPHQFALRYLKGRKSVTLTPAASC